MRRLGLIVTVMAVTMALAGPASASNTVQWDGRRGLDSVVECGEGQPGYMHWVLTSGSRNAVLTIDGDTDHTTSEARTTRGSTHFRTPWIEDITSASVTASGIARNARLTISDACRPADDDGPVLGTGDIQATLRWHADDDLDLHVISPSGEHVWYAQRSVPSGGTLDVDSNVGTCGQDMPPAVENIFWPEESAPTGTYTVRVHEYNLCTEVSPEWRLTVKVDGVTVIDHTGQGNYQTTFQYPSP